MRKRTPKVPTPKIVIKGKLEKQESSERLVDNTFEYYTDNNNICVVETTKNKSPPRLVDEPVIPPTYLIKDGADLLKMSFAEYEKRLTAEGAQGANVEKDAEKTTENVEAGGENVEKKFVEGLVHTDSSETESDEIDPTNIEPTPYVSGKQKYKRSPKKKKVSDEEDATYEPTPKEKKKMGIKKWKAHPIRGVPRSVKARKDTTSIPQHESKVPKSPEYERVERTEVRDKDVEVDFIGNVEEPTSASKKPTTSQSSSHRFPKIQHELGAGPIGLEDVGDLFNEGKVNTLEREVSVLEKAKAKAEEKLEAVEAENIALRKEIQDHAEVSDQLTDGIEEVNAQYKTIDNANKMLHEMLGELHTSIANENEVLRKEAEALRTDKVIKEEQLNMLYIVDEHKLGINVQAVFDEIEIQRVEARGLEREKRLAEEAAESKKDQKKGLVIDIEEILGSSSQPNPTQEYEVNISNVDNTLVITPVGELKDVTPKEIRVDRRKIIEKRHSESKDDKEKEDDDEEDEELNELFKEIDDYDGDNDDDDNDDDDDDDDGDNDDDDDQGATGLLIVKHSDQNTLEDFLNDELNEQQEDQHQEVSSYGNQHAGDKVFLTIPKVIYLHAEVEGELEENRTRESMLEELGMDDGKLKFDIEEEIPQTPNRKYSFKFMNEANNFNNVIIEEGFDISEQDTPFHYAGVNDDFPTLTELF
ncbi:hypothetical protein Hanom_Chr06g00539281 [Helianthus anomalus]